MDHIVAATELTTYEENSLLETGAECGTTCIKKWTVGARTSEEIRSPSHILILQQNSMLRKHDFELSPLTTTPYVNVYEFEVDRAVCVKNFFLKIRSSQIYYHHYASDYYVDRPLVAADHYCTGECSHGCTRGFIGLEELREKARYIPNFAANVKTKTFPDLRIAENGLVVKLTFIAEELEPTYSRTKYP
jgi:hypothetical protein